MVLQYHQMGSSSRIDLQDGRCRVLFDNHHGKKDHLHFDDRESEYEFISVDHLWDDFFTEIRKLGGFV